MILNHDRLALPVLLLLLMALIPSAGVIWMMREAIRNERLAANQRLLDAYEIQLQSATAILEKAWASDMANPMDADRVLPPSIRFAMTIHELGCDGALVLDDDGRVVYPTPTGMPRIQSTPTDPELQKANRAEFQNQQYAEAAKLYAGYAAAADSDAERVRGRQGQIRCLVQANQIPKAIQVLRQLQNEPDLVDDHGRSVAATSEARLIDLMSQDGQSSAVAVLEIAESLRQRILDYGNGMPSSQRLFLMQQLDFSGLIEEPWPMMVAETNSTRLLSAADSSAEHSLLRPIPETAFWTQRRGNVIAIFYLETITAKLYQLAEQFRLPDGVRLAVSPPSAKFEVSPILSMPLGEPLGNWQLGIVSTHDNLLDASVTQRRAIHVWIGCMIVAITCVLAWILLRLIQSRMRLARLKNDLVATVSHELKTPLASMRLLVDTLLNAGERASSSQTAEYLELISQENRRLTRLIDHFLTFSRLETTSSLGNGADAIDAATVAAEEIVGSAARIFKKHYPAAAGFLKVQSRSHANVQGDRDVLIIAVVNLLENAWKYRRDDTPIVLSSDHRDGQLSISVQDQGIGLTKRQARNVFGRFYRVDQNVTRSSEGCGLGLSIVQRIVQNHGGRIEVASEPNHGSTFTIKLPIHSAAPATQLGATQQFEPTSRDHRK